MADFVSLNGYKVKDEEARKSLENTVITVPSSDGTFDDTAVVRDCINKANALGVKAVFEKGKKYLLNPTESIIVKTSVDFNGATIIPHENCNVDIFTVQQEMATYNYSQAAFNAKGVTLDVLKGKTFGLVSPMHMCYRNGSSSDTQLTYCRTFQTDEYGNFISGYYEPEIITGTYTFANVMDKNIAPISVGNCVIDLTRRGNNCCVIRIVRNNVHLHDIAIKGIAVNASGYTDATINISTCANIEISRIYGVNPTPLKASGYLFGLYNLTDVYMHDCSIGGGLDTWGAIGSGNISNMVFERVTINRIDTHTFYHGSLIVRDCNICEISIAGGYGDVVVENTAFYSYYNASYPNHRPITFREDYKIFPNGRITFKNCRFYGLNTDYIFYFNRESAPEYDTAAAKITGCEITFESCSFIDSKPSNLGRFWLNEVYDGMIALKVEKCKINSVGCYPSGAGSLKTLSVKNCEIDVAASLTQIKEININECKIPRIAIWGSTRPLNVSFTNNTVTGDNSGANNEVRGETIYLHGNKITTDAPLVIANYNTHYVVENNLFYGTSTFTNLNKWNLGKAQPTA